MTSSGERNEGILREAGIDLAAEVTSVPAARSFVATMLDLWSCDDPDQVIDLLTSEIVTNAVRHASGPIRVEAALGEDGSLRVRATDDHPGIPELRAPDLGAEGGRGVLLVQSLAKRWGVEQETGRKVVWFEAPVVQRDPRR